MPGENRNLPRLKAVWLGAAPSRWAWTERSRAWQTLAILREDQALAHSEGEISGVQGKSSGRVNGRRGYPGDFVGIRSHRRMHRHRRPDRLPRETRVHVFAIFAKRLMRRRQVKIGISLARNRRVDVLTNFSLSGL